MKVKPLGDRVLVEPVEEKGRSRLYLMADIVNAMVNSEELDFQQERAALARAQRLKLEREAQIAAEREMIPRADVEAAFKELAGVVRVYLLNHFHNRKLPPLLAAERDVHKCSVLLKEARDEMLDAMEYNFRGKLNNPKHDTRLWGAGMRSADE